MNIIDRARRDMQRFTGNTVNGFAQTLVFTPPTGATATVPGLHTKHHMDANNDGRLVNTKQMHVSCAEKALTDAGYTTRVNGQCSFKGHKVTVSDAAGTHTYKVQEWFPDEQLGLIVFILGDYSA